MQAAVRPGGDAGPLEVLHCLREREPGHGRRLPLRYQVLRRTVQAGCKKCHSYERFPRSSVDRN